jgi:hypothetical protein
MPGGVFEMEPVGRTLFRTATMKGVANGLLDIMALYVQSGKGTLDLTPDCGRWRNESSLSRQFAVTSHDLVAG